MRSRVAEGLALAGLLVLTGLVYGRGLDAAANYDEGVYLASLDALRHGQELGTDVYASQPPGFYVLLQALSLLPGDGVTGIRVAFLLVAFAGVAAAYAIGRRLAAVWGGLGAAVLLAVTAPYPVQTARVQADTASVALSLVAVAVAMYAGRSWWRWAAAGAFAGAAVSVKLLALPVLAPLAVLLVARRSWRAACALAAGAAAVWAALTVAYAGALGELWQSVVSDHRVARKLGPSLADNIERVLLHPLDWRTPAAVLVVVGLVCAAVMLRRVELLALGAWIAASAVFLLAQRPLLDHHLVLLATVLAVPAGAGLGAALAYSPRERRGPLAVVLAAVLAIAFVQEGRRLARQPGEASDVRRAAAAIRAASTAGELVVTDVPIVAYLADRRVPGELVDTSYVRLGTGSLTDKQILAALDRSYAPAVAVGREFAGRPELIRALRQRYRVELKSGAITLYLAP